MPITCTIPPSREQLAQLKEIERETKRFFIQQQQYISSFQTKNKPVKIPEHLWKLIKQEYHENFDMKQGTYKLKISIKDKRGSVTDYISSDFIISNDDIKTLQSHLN